MGGKKYAMIILLEENRAAKLISEKDTRARKVMALC